MLKSIIFLKIWAFFRTNSSRISRSNVSFSLLLSSQQQVIEVAHCLRILRPSWCGVHGHSIARWWVSDSQKTVFSGILDRLKKIESYSIQKTFKRVLNFYRQLFIHSCWNTGKFSIIFFFLHFVTIWLWYEKEKSKEFKFYFRKCVLFIFSNKSCFGPKIKWCKHIVKTELKSSTI